MQRLERFDNRRGRIVAVDLIEIDVIDTKPPERIVDGLHDMATRQPAVVRVVRQRIKHLGRDDDFVSPHEVMQRPPDDFFAHTQRVVIRGVEEVDAGIESLFENQATLGFIEHPRPPGRRAVRHRTQTEAGNVEIGRAEL
jgi:hypothetical protein